MPPLDPWFQEGAHLKHTSGQHPRAAVCAEISPAEGGRCRRRMKNMRSTSHPEQFSETGSVPGRPRAGRAAARLQATRRMCSAPSARAGRASPAGTRRSRDFPVCHLADRRPRHDLQQIGAVRSRHHRRGVVEVGADGQGLEELGERQPGRPSGRVRCEGARHDHRAEDLASARRCPAGSIISGWPGSARCRVCPRDPVPRENRRSPQPISAAFRGRWRRDSARARATTPAPSSWTWRS